MLHTFVRTNELLEAKWHEFDMEGKTWLIPAERMKMRKAHLVPLSIQVLKFLNDLKSQNTNSEYILTSLHSSKIPMSNNTILYALYRMGYKGKTTGHGFRALAMTTIKEKLQGIDSEPIFDFFRQPPVTTEYTLSWGEPDHDGIMKMLCNEYDFAPDRVEKALAGMQVKKGQKTLDAWF